MAPALSPSQRVAGLRAYRLLTFAVLVLVTVIAFEGVLGNGWIFFDDHEYVTRNPHVRAGLTWEGLTWFLREFHVGNWHPLTSWSHMLDVELFGLSPRGPHAVNLALHVANACLLLHVLHLYTRRWWPSALVAALFALHPLRVESVAWISERKDVLSAFFFFLTLWAYHAWVTEPTRARRALLIVAFVLGLLAKPMLVTAPFVLLLLDVWPLARTQSFRARALEKWPLFVAMAASIVSTVVAQTASGATTNLQDNPVWARLYTATTSYARYLGQTFAPHDLTPAYPYARVFAFTFPILSLIGITLITVLVLRWHRSRPHLAIGWLWYLGMLVPVIGLVQVGSQSHADRYTYLPSIGIALALAFEAADLVARKPAWRRPIMAAACVACLALMLLTRAQVALWHDTRTLFEHTLRVTPDNPTAEKVYGDTLIEEGDFTGAVPHFERALEISPLFPNGRNNLGCALARAGRFDEAAEQFRIAAQDEPTFDVYLNWGSACCDAGRFADAITPLETAVSLNPNSAPAHSMLGRALGNLQRGDESAAHLARALQLDPDDIEARRASAIAFMSRGQIESAVAEYRRVLLAHPTDVDTLVTVALIRGTHPDAAHRDGAEAVACAERARDASPEPFADLFGALAGAYAEVGRFDDAVTAATRAVELARREGDAGVLVHMERQLDEHKAGRPYRAR